MTLSLDHISFSYASGSSGSSAKTINDLSVSFKPGCFTSIIGPNGSGKTTLLDLVSGFLKPDVGAIKINNTPILTFSKNDLARQISLVSQDYTINFPFHVKDVVMMGRHPYIPRFAHPTRDDVERVEYLLEQCGIAHLRNRKINELSGGERQRCVFARALCQDTPILLLDEAFSNMDIRHTLEMLGLVKRLAREKNRMVISVFHDLNLASSWSDELLMLKKGKIHCFGKSQDVLTQDSIQTVFNVNALVTTNPNIRKKQVSYPIQ